LSDQLREAVKKSRRHTDNVDKIVRAYVTSAYGGVLGVDYPENVVQEWTALVLPSIVHDNPRVSVGDEDSDVATLSGMLRAVLNRWIPLTGMRNSLIEIGHDFSIAFGGGLVTYEPRFPNIPNSPWLPKLRRMSPRMMGCDPLARSWDTARWQYWVEEIAPMDLQRRAERENAQNPRYGWDIDAIRNAPRQKAATELRANATADSQEEIVTLFHVVVPGEDLPESPGPGEGFNGTCYTVAASPEGSTIDAWLKRPGPFFGPRRGPLTLFPGYPVMDSPYPLAPIAAVWPQIEALNLAAINANTGAAKYKRVVLYPAAEKNAIDMIAAADDLLFIPVPGLDKEYMIPIEVGGLTAQMIDHLKMQRDRVDRAIGINDAMRGSGDPNRSATSDAIADQSSTKRIAFLKQRFTDGVIGCLKSAAHYLVFGREVRMSMGSDVANQLGYGDPVYYGGSMGLPPEAMAIDDLGINIQPYSMERVSESALQRQSALILELATNLAPIMGVTPGVDWKGLLDQVGNANNIPRLSRYFPGIAMGAMVPGMLPPGAAPGIAGAPLQGNPGNAAAGNLAALRVA
jgi:hypothetical protein